MTSSPGQPTAGTYQPTPDASAVLARVRELGLDFVRLEYQDWAGLVRGRTVSADHLESAFANGINSAQAAMTMAMDDGETDPQIAAQAGDFWLMPEPTTFRPLTWQPGFGQMLVSLVEADGAPWWGDPRALLKRVVEQVRAELGAVTLGYEQEGILLRKAGERFVRGMVTRTFTADAQDETPQFYRDMLAAVRAAGGLLEKFTIEGPHGLVELNVRFGDPLAAADQHLRFKQAFRAIARQHGFVGTFLPRPFAREAGVGLHLHIGLRDRDERRDLFGSADDRRAGLSEVGLHFVGGLLSHANALTAISSPIINSYKRLRPGFWAPAYKGFGRGNRSAMIRVVERRTTPGAAAATRLELRSPDGTCNSYLLAAAVIAAGLDGVRRRLDPGPPSDLDFGNLPATTSELPLLPRSLDRALDALERDDLFRSCFGSALLDGYVRVKRYECDAFAAAVTDWEHQTYLEFY